MTVWTKFSEAVETLLAMQGNVQENATEVQNQTGIDRYKLLDPDPYLSESERIRFALVWSTPKSVWRDYEANGYTIQEAIESELGYAN